MAPGLIDGQPKPSKKAPKGGGRKAAPKQKAQGGCDPALRWLFDESSKQHLTAGATPHRTTAC